VRRESSWIQTLGYFPLNIMQNRLAKLKIEGGMQRFRTARDEGAGAEDRLVVDEGATLQVETAPPPRDPGVPARKALPLVE
jgi:hypothetical protein